MHLLFQLRAVFLTAICCMPCRLEGVSDDEIEEIAAPTPQKRGRVVKEKYVYLPLRDLYRSQVHSRPLKAAHDEDFQPVHKTVSAKAAGKRYV